MRAAGRAPGLFSGAMAHPLDDPWIMEKIDKVVAEYRTLWTDDQVRAFREMMAWTLATHPKASRLVERERAVQADKSGTRSRADEGSADELAERKESTR